MFYQAIISSRFDWKNKSGWQIELICGKFDTIMEAAIFGRDVMFLWHPRKANYFRLKDGQGVVHKIDNNSITVKELKPKYLDQLMTENNELKVIDLSEEEFGELPFNYSSLSYGVRDEFGADISLSEWQKPLNQISCFLSDCLTLEQLEEFRKNFLAGTAEPIQVIFNPYDDIPPLPSNQELLEDLLGDI